MAKRRPSGDGMVRKREDGRWEGRIVVGHKSFKWTEMESLKTNLARLKDTEKNLRINFDIRY